MQIKSNDIIKQYKNTSFNDVIKENLKYHNSNWPQIPIITTEYW